MALPKTLALIGLFTLAAHAGEYSFPTRDGVVKLTVDFLPAYTGTRLAVYSGATEIPLSKETGFAATPQRFVGAGALVRYTVAPTGRKSKAKAVRERVVLLGQSEGLPDRPVFHKTVKLVNGVASDLQLFGYDEDALPESDRAAAREQAKGFYRRFRQELFLDDQREPFAVLEWTHKVDQIALTLPAGPEVAARQ